MKHFKHFFALMLIALSLCPTLAQTQQHEAPYELDLNTRPSSTSGAFKLAAGWQHLQDGSLSGYYSYNANNGYDRTGWLYCTQQGEGVNDLLVTPALSGDVNMLAKVYNTNYVENASIRFFEIAERPDGTLEMGDELESVVDYVSSPADPADPAALNGSDFVRVSLARPLAQPTLVGIRLEYVGIDNFHADEADVTLYPGLSFSSASLTTTKPEVTPEGKYTLAFSLRVRNSGEVDLQAGDRGYEVEVYSNSREELLGVFPIEQDLAVGTTSNYFTVEVEMDYEQYPSAEQFYVKENITGNEYNVSGTSTPVPYEYIFGVANGSNSLSSGDELNFGMVQGQKSITLTAYNDGTAPVTISSMEMTNGFTVEGIAENTVLAGGQEQSFTVSTPAGAAGELTSRLTINYGAGKRMTLNFKATVMDPDKWFEDFQGGSIPANMVVTTSGYSYWGIFNDANDSSNKVLRTTSYNEDMISSPLLELAEGESISFQAARYSYNAKLNIYWSADRKNWTHVQTIGTSNDLDEQWQLPSANNTWATYSVTGFPAGRIYIGFGASYIILDDIYGGKLVAIEHDMQLTNSSLPEEGTVNHAVNATATFKNLNTKAEVADGYAVRLYVDGQAVAEAETADIDVNAQKTFDFTYTPHQAGEHRLYIAFEAGDYELKTAEATFVVAEETVSNDIVAGNPTTTTQNAPLWVNYENSESEIIYTADQLGIRPGSKITKIVYRGYSTASGTVTSHVKAWIENTTDSNITYSDGIKSTAEMTPIFDDDITFERVGSSSNKVDLIVINLSEPFVYEGDNLRLSFHAESNSYKQVYFEAQSLTNQCIYRGVSNLNQLSTKTPSNCFYLPVARMSVEKDPTTLSGTVTFKADGLPVANQSVTLTSGDVVYEATTGADGQYSMTVVQDELTYQLRVERDDYNPFIREVSFTAGSQVVNVELDKSKGLVAESITVPADAVANSEATVVVKASNYSQKDVAADYTARLFNAAGEQLAEAEAVVIKAGEQHDFVFTFLALGTAPIEVYAVFESADFTAESAHATFTPAPEYTGGELVAGEANGFHYSTPFDLYYPDGSMTQTVYTAAQLGLNPGEIITHIAYKGYMSDYNDVNVNVKIYMENVGDDTGTVGSNRSMTKVVDRDVTFIRQGGQYSPVTVFEADLDEPFTYEGGNLRVWAEHVAMSENDWAQNAYFQTDSRGASYRNRDPDGNILDEWERLSAQPVLYLTTTNAKILSGSVTDAAGAPVPGAEVKLSSAEAVYQTVTNDRGMYTLEVTKTQYDYTFSVEAEGFVAEREANVSLSEAMSTKDVVLSYAAREFAEGETYTVCLPVAVDASAMKAAGKFYTLVGMVDDVLQFDEVEQVEAYTPYLVVAAAGANSLFSDVNAWTVDADRACTTTVDNISFVGTMTRQKVEAQKNMGYYGYRAADGVFGQFTMAYVSPFRAYITIDEKWPAAARAFQLNDLLPTGITNIEQWPLGTDHGYDLQGRRVKMVSGKNVQRHGIYVVNGKKVVY